MLGYTWGLLGCVLALVSTAASTVFTTNKRLLNETKGSWLRHLGRKHNGSDDHNLEKCCKETNGLIF